MGGVCLIVVAVIMILMLIGVYLRGERLRKQCEIRTALRRLWIDHVVYTRLYIIANLNRQANADVLAARLMKNQEDIGKAVAELYGADKSACLVPLLKTHISGAVDLVNAVYNGVDTKNLAAAWYANGDDIAACLTNINSKYDLATNRAMMKLHLDKTILEVKNIHGKAWEDDIKNYDAITDDIMAMADHLAGGM
jgi:hypothetical protein